MRYHAEPRGRTGPDDRLGPPREDIRFPTVDPALRNGPGARWQDCSAMNERRSGMYSVRELFPR